MKPLKLIKNSLQQPLIVVGWNFLLAMLLLSACRIFFFLIYHDTFSDVTFSHLITMCAGGLRFDLSTLLLFNSLYALVMLLPFRFRANRLYQTIAQYIFSVINSLLIVMNCVDMIYFPFNNKRTTITFLSEFQNEGNLLKIIGISMVQYWYVTLFGVIMVALLIVGYNQ